MEVEALKQTVFLTIASLGYLPQVRCLFESLRLHHPEARLVLCLTEEQVEAELFDADEFEVVLARSVVGPGFYKMAFDYDIVELNTAVKPFAMQWLIDNGARRVTYIDPDCFLFSRLEELTAAHEGGANIVLTPHATRPISDNKKPGELDFLRAGTFNLGFVSVQASAVTSSFLEWWSERLRSFCQFDPISGLFVDQKWVDLAPCFFDGVVVLRHAGYNVAYWNAFQRTIERRAGGWQVDDVPLRFFHFSSVPQDDVSQIARHQDRLDGDSIGPFFAEFQTYLARLASNALTAREQTSYSYCLRWRGKPIDCLALRAMLRRSGAAEAQSLSDFDSDELIAPLLKPHPELPVDEMFPISRLLYDAWLHAPLIAAQFPLFTAEGRAKFLYWVLDGGYRALQIDNHLLPWRELTSPVPSAAGGKLAVPPIFWLVWLSDKRLRRATHLKDEAAYANLLLELQKQVSAGDRPRWVLPSEYTAQTVVGEGDDAVNIAQYALWCTRKDLQSVFDLDSAQARHDFLTWCAGPSPLAECPWMAPLIASPQVRQVTAS